MMAAGRAAELGAKVLLLEKTPRAGSKIAISGKTRCNLTNTKELDAFVAMYGPNGRFLYSAFHRFFRDDLLAFLRRYGVETKSERGGRVFPVSDDAADVVTALKRSMADHRVEVRTDTRVTSIQVDKGRVGRMIPHFGIGGPIALLMGLAIVDALENGPVSVSIDLEPALDEKQLRQRLQRDFDRHGKRSYRNILKGM